jgi:hypothetical protein
LLSGVARQSLPVASGPIGADPRPRRPRRSRSKAIDSLMVEAPDDEKTSRKRRLLKGPEEFREVRVDGPMGQIARFI